MVECAQRCDLVQMSWRDTISTLHLSGLTTEAWQQVELHSANVAMLAAQCCAVQLSDRQLSQETGRVLSEFECSRAEAGLPEMAGSGMRLRSDSADSVPPLLKEYFAAEGDRSIAIDRIAELDHEIGKQAPCEITGQHILREAMRRAILVDELQAATQEADRLRAECFAQALDPERMRYRHSPGMSCLASLDLWC
jgi:hypothetical protein